MTAPMPHALVALFLTLLGLAELGTLWMGLAWLEATAHLPLIALWSLRSLGYLAGARRLVRGDRRLAAVMLVQIWALYLSPLARYEVDWDLRRWWSLAGLVALALVRPRTAPGASGA